MKITYLFAERLSQSQEEKSSRRNCLTEQSIKCLYCKKVGCLNQANLCGYI